MGKNKGVNKLAGFTLVELMVTISIMVIINGVIFFNYPKVMANLALRRTADEIALMARQAQAYAMAAKSIDEERPPKYGVHFDTSLPNNTKIVLFADVDTSGVANKYDGSDSPTCGNECIQIFEIQTKDKISDLLGDGATRVNSADIIYSRLNFVATITTNPPGSYANIKIEITARRNSNAKKYITIHSNGYVSVQ